VGTQAAPVDPSRIPLTHSQLPHIPSRVLGPRFGETRQKRQSLMLIDRVIEYVWIEYV